MVLGCQGPQEQTGWKRTSCIFVLAHFLLLLFFIIIITNVIFLFFYLGLIIAILIIVANQFPAVFLHSLLQLHPSFSFSLCTPPVSSLASFPSPSSSSFFYPPPPFSWIQRRLPPRSGRDAGGAFKPALYGSYGMQPGQAGPGSGHTQPCWFACPVSGGGPSVSTRLNPAASLPHPCVSHAISLCLPCDTSVSPLLHPCDSSATPRGLPCSFFATHPCLPCRFISLYPESLPIV